MVELIREWWYDTSSVKVISDRVYPIQNMKKTTLVSKHNAMSIVGEKDPHKFKLGWILLIHEILARKIFNWEHIRLANL